MTALNEERRPAGTGSGVNVSDGNLDSPSVAPVAYTVADLDAWAEALSGRFVVQVTVDAERGYRRTNVYRSCAAAERAVERARLRGQTAHVTLARLLPVGVVAGVVR
jgi:hypothetical protein